MGKYLNATGRPIVYSCSWPAYEEPNGKEVFIKKFKKNRSFTKKICQFQSNYTALIETCNLWRNWDDIDDAWSNITNILSWFSKHQDRIAKHSGPGHWNDPDMVKILYKI